MKIKQRCFAVILIIAIFCSFIQPVFAVSMLDQRFNLGYGSSLGKTIFSGFYENPSIPTSYSKLADRAIAIKNTKYSYSSAIQILNETKAVLNKTTQNDYNEYEDMFQRGVQSSSSVANRFTYDSFIMRNVLYAMYMHGASYTQMLNAIQIIYDCAIVQSQKDAFRCDALDVLADLKIMAGYEGEGDRADMLYFVSSFASGMQGKYDGKTTLSSVDVAAKYQKYLEEQANKDKGDDEIKDNTEQDNAGNVSGGVGDVNVISPGFKPGGSWDSNHDSTGNDSYFSDRDFGDTLNNLQSGQGLGTYVLFYTTEKNNKDPLYYRTKITTRESVSYENIVSALLTASRNTDLVLVEDSNAVLLVHNGSCTVLAQSDKKYTTKDVAELFSSLKEFGLFLGEENSVKIAK